MIPFSARFPTQRDFGSPPYLSGMQILDVYGIVQKGLPCSSPPFGDKFQRWITIEYLKRESFDPDDRLHKFLILKLKVIWFLKHVPSFLVSWYTPSLQWLIFPWSRYWPNSKVKAVLPQTFYTLSIHADAASVHFGLLDNQKMNMRFLDFIVRNRGLFI